jgi:hypothetical protein
MGRGEEVWAARPRSVDVCRAECPLASDSYITSDKYALF